MTVPGNLLPRDPAQEVRTKRFMQVLGTLMNSLMQGGIVVQTGPQTWGIAGLFFAGSGAPAAPLGVPGDFYLDTASGLLYEKF